MVGNPQNLAKLFKVFSLLVFFEQLDHEQQLCRLMCASPTAADLYKPPSRCNRDQCYIKQDLVFLRQYHWRCDETPF